MRISDWSSDVCSSDLGRPHIVAHQRVDRGFLVGISLELEVADIAVATRGERGIILAALEDGRTDEDHQVGLRPRPAARFEEFADQRNIAEQRDAFDRLALVVVEQAADREDFRSEEHTSELQSLMRISYAVFCLKKKK